MIRSLLFVVPLVFLVSGASVPVAAQSFDYALDGESVMLTGCTEPSPCLCPILYLGDISGSFQLEFFDLDGAFEVYTLEGVDWTVNEGEANEFVITGGGTYRVDVANSLQEMTLELVVDGEPQDYESLGVVPGGGTFPMGFSLGVFDQINGCQWDELFLSSVFQPPTNVDFLRGDANGDGSVNGLTDGLFLLAFQFVPGSPAPACEDAADIDDDGTLNGLIDGLFALNYQFVPGSPAPPLPGPDSCGGDPSDDALNCSVLACP